jgi:phosphotriesterase-related protein
VISHVDRTLFTDEDLFRLADTGAVVEFDFFGIESSHYPFQDDIDLPNDGMRLRMVRRLIDRGHLDRIALSQDICTRTRLQRWGGHGYRHLFENVVPMMRRRGFTEDEIDTLLVRTPRRLLTIPA